MISRGFAAQQIHRLRVTNYFSMLDEDGIGELAGMLGYSDNEIVAVAVVNQWLEEQTERPTPADIRRLVAVHNEARQTSVEPMATTYKCNACQDSGMRGGDIGGDDARPWEWCDCPESWPIRSKSPLLVDQANEIRRKLLVSPRALKSIPRGHRDVGKVYGDA